MTLITITTAAILSAAIWAVLCRIEKMQHRRTSIKVFIQHAALGSGLFVALFVPPQFALLAVSSGVFVFLLMGASRWRKGPPDGIKTDAPPPIDSALMRHAHGGKR